VAGVRDEIENQVRYAKHHDHWRHWR